MFNFRSVFSFGVSSAPSEKQRIFVGKLKSFSNDEDGIATVWAMFWLIVCFSLSGLAIDVTNAWKVHAILQSTADVSAFAGAYELQSRDENNQEMTNYDIYIAANDWAVDFAERNMDPNRYGEVLLEQDVQLGYWSGGIFTPMPVLPVDDETYNSLDPADAIRVITRQSGTNKTSGVGTFFLRFAGFDEFTVATYATVKLFTQQCWYDGLIAAGQIKLSTGQRFLNTFCVHGEKGIFAAQNNYFQLSDDGEKAGVIASAPTEDGCGQNITKCDDSVNEGFATAFEKQSLFPNTDTTGLTGKPAKVDDYIASFLGDTSGVNYIPEYATVRPSPIILSGNEILDASDLVEGGIYEIECRTGKPVKLSFPDDYTEDKILHDIVVVSEGCDFIFDSSVTYRDAIFATGSTSQQTFSGASGIVFGTQITVEENWCKSQEEMRVITRNPDWTNGAVTLITKGSVNFASKLQAYDLEIIAEKNVHLAAEVSDESLHIGTSVSAGGDISVTRNHSFHGCPTLGNFDKNNFDPERSWALVE